MTSVAPCVVADSGVVIGKHLLPFTQTDVGHADIDHGAPKGWCVLSIALTVGVSLTDGAR
jgi:hypothetical protein